MLSLKYNPFRRTTPKFIQHSVVLSACPRAARQCGKPFACSKCDAYFIFLFAVPSDKAIRIPESRLQSTMFFPMPMAVTDRSLKRATLLIYLETPYGFENQIATLNLTTNRITKNRGIHLSKVGLIDGGKWHHIDITKEAKAWTRGEWLNNLGLVAEATVEGIHIFHFNNSQLGQNSSIERVSIVS